MSLNVFAQNADSILVSIGVDINGNPMMLDDSTYVLLNGNKIKIETLKFYISEVQLYQNETLYYSEPNRFHLVDISDPATLRFKISPSSPNNFNMIKFDLGIDSTTNVSGAMGGDLDPTKGMYWTWQSGYINFKMEGTCYNGQGQKRKFEFHLGGYTFPFNALQKVALKTENMDHIQIVLDLGRFFSHVDVSTQKNIMSPSTESLIISKILANSFGIK
jgi:hypothetical protein